MVFRGSVGLVREGGSSAFGVGDIKAVHVLVSSVVFRSHSDGVEVQVHLQAVSLGIQELLLENSLVLVDWEDQLEVASLAMGEVLFGLVFLKLNHMPHEGIHLL